MDTDFQQVVNTYADGMYRLAYSFCANRADAEDVVQEVLIKYLQRPPRCNCPEQLRAWLMKATANKCRDLLRSGWRRKTQPLAQPCAPPEADDAALDVRAALMQLPPGQRGAVYLYYYEQFTTRMEEIGKIASAASRPLTFDSIMRRKKESRDGIDFAFFPELGEMLNIGTTDLMTVGADSGLGKTAFLINLAADFSTDPGKNVIYYNIEVDEASITDRLICARARNCSSTSRRRATSPCGSITPTAIPR